MTDPRAARAPAPESVELLRQRAAELARPVKTPDDSGRVTAVMFELGRESYALAATVVLEVFVLRAISPLPGAPAPLFGVTQWRGDVLTVLDLRDALGSPRRGVTDLSRVLVVDGPDRRFGVLADAARGAADLATDQIRSLPDDQEGTLLRGITDAGVLVIDEKALLDRYGRNT